MGGGEGFGLLLKTARRVKRAKIWKSEKKSKGLKFSRIFRAGVIF